MSEFQLLDHTYELISTLFDEAIAKEIMSIPLNPRSAQDRLIWHYNKNGIYSVSSAYKLARAMTIDSSHEVQSGWKNLWKLEVPPKVKLFLWRAAHDCLPNKANLLRKRVDVDGECGHSCGGYENSWHSFVACHHAEATWSLSPYLDDVRKGRDTCESFVEFLFYVMNMKNAGTKSGMAMILWQLWKDRNDAVWNNKAPIPSISIRLARHVLSEWQSENASHAVGAAETRRRRGCNGWHDLHVGWFRCKVDAAFFSNLNLTGIGMVLQDFSGSFVAARTLTLPGTMRVEEGEAMGMLEALSWIKQKGMEQVEFCSDSKLVVDAVKSQGKDDSELGAIISSCRRILVSSVGFRVNYAHRESIVVAHKLARLSKDFITTYVWDEPLDDVEGLLVLPCVCA